MQAWGMEIMRWKQFTAVAVGAVMLLSMTGCDLADELAAMADDVKESVLGDDSSGNKKERKKAEITEEATEPATTEVTTTVTTTEATTTTVTTETQPAATKIEISPGVNQQDLPPSTPAQPIEPAWKSLYREKLHQIAAEPNMSTPECTFNLYDVDGDGVPELFFSPGTYHVSACYMYTVYNGTLFDLGPVGEYGTTFCYAPEHLVFFQGGGQGYFSYAVYRLESGALQPLITYFNSEAAVPDPSTATYQINDENVSRETYYAETAKWNRDWTTISGQYDMSYTTIEAVITAY